MPNRSSTFKLNKRAAPKSQVKKMASMAKVVKSLKSVASGSAAAASASAARLTSSDKTVLEKSLYFLKMQELRDICADQLGIDSKGVKQLLCRRIIGYMENGAVLKVYLWKMGLF